MFIDPKAKVAVYEFDDQTVTYTEDGQREEPNIIFIRPKMPYGVKQNVISAGSKVSKDGEVGFDGGAWRIALLTNNIVGWQGPKFQTEGGGRIPCNAANILLLDPTEPLVVKVIAEIDRRNAEPKVPEGADPKSLTTGTTSESDG